MNNAFIFDMDGVIVNSEKIWLTYEHQFHEKLFGKEIRQKMGDLVGLSIYRIYDRAVTYGFSLPKEEFFRWYDNQAKIIYQETVVSDSLHKLISYLRSNDMKVGLVSGSPGSWIKMALKKAKLERNFDYILSLHDREDLADKPAPDGYIAAMKVLQVTPQDTIILEDSNTGIKAAKASGAYTIGYRQHLLPGYKQKGADVYANSMGEVITIVEKQLEKM